MTFTFGENHYFEMLPSEEIKLQNFIEEHKNCTPPEGEEKFVYYERDCGFGCCCYALHILCNGCKKNMVVTIEEISDYFSTDNDEDL